MSGINIKTPERLRKLPPYLFAEIDKAKRKARREGKDIIDLGVGDPDTPTPSHVIEALYKAAKDPGNHRYSLDAGMPEFRAAVCKWYSSRFGVKLDPEKEVLPLIGSKEGIAHLPLAVLEPGEVSLVPDPCYPPYRSGTIFAGGTVYSMPLREENAFLPDLDSIPGEVLKKAKLLYLNYPNNPTAAVCEPGFFDRAVEFAAKHNLIVCHDAAYSELSYDGCRCPSFLESEGARDVAVEFHSLSKTYNMTGWRVGFAVGNSAVISLLGRLKSNLDSGIFQAVQIAGIAAIETPEEHLEKLKSMYQRRRDALISGFGSKGWKIIPPKATFYVWTRVPNGSSSAGFCARLLEEANIVATPGTGFGQSGEGYLRMALTVSEERIREAAERIGRIL